MNELALMNIKVTVGLRFKELRLSKQLSQEALANKADLDRTYVTDVENGRRNISIENIEKLVNALDVSISDFFNAPNFRN